MNDSPRRPWPGSPAPKPAEVVWRGETVLVTRDDRRWSILRGGRRIVGPPFLSGERWSLTQDRIREWLDVQEEPERLA